MTTAGIDTLPRISSVATAQEYADVRKKSWIAVSDRGYEVLTHDNGWTVMSSKDFDIGGGFGWVLDQLDITHGPYREEWNKIIVCTEGAQREHMRKPYMHLLKPQQVAKLQSLVRELIHGILDDIKDPTNVDFMAEIGDRLPPQLYCELVSAPRELAPEVWRITNSINPPLITFNKARVKESEDAFWEGMDFLREHIEARRTNLGDDFTSELIRCEQDGMISPEEVTSVAMSLLIASMDNTMHQLGLSFGTLLEDRSRWEEVLARPTASTQAAEETFRLCPRFNVITRHASKDVIVGDFTFPADSWIMVATRSTGRDETKFESPNEFRLNRPASKALQFGGSSYSCLGAILARLEISEMIRIVAERFPKIRMIGDWKAAVGPMVSECEHLRVSLV
ncbi:cytochrome P450 [Xanthobacter autotrophicus]|uniref:cytochrome P450 n=1 Tax=Xanthobacter autotrophicus TaxID=280 RepID=UPI0024A629D0|nr:cytochrome P450 [Xanthobacter autotrophicus]MDI4655137.1 cytochrome P450 [Xanthobacter autotrophicus]